MALGTQKTKPDEFCDDGKTRKMNPSRPYGVVYADGFEETKFVQDSIPYRGDRTPIGYVPASERGLTPVEPTREELLTENEQMRRQIDALLKRVDAIERERTPTATPPPTDKTLHVSPKRA